MAMVATAMVVTWAVVWATVATAMVVTAMVVTATAATATVVTATTGCHLMDMEATTLILKPLLLMVTAFTAAKPMVSNAHSENSTTTDTQDILTLLTTKPCTVVTATVVWATAATATVVWATAATATVATV